MILPGHAALHIAGDANNGPVRIQIALYQGYQSLDFLDYGVANTKQPIGLDADGADPNTDYPSGRRLIYAGTTTLSNPDILDGANDGAGIATDIVTDPAGPFDGHYVPGIAGCMVFVQKMLGRLFPNSKFPIYDAWVVKYQTYIHNKFLFNTPQTLRVAFRQIQAWGDSSQNLVKIFNVLGHNQLALTGAAASQGQAMLFQDESELYRNNVPVASPWDEQKPPTVKLGGVPPESPFSLTYDGGCEKRSFHEKLTRRCTPTSTMSDGIGDLALVRVNNIMATIALIPEAAVQAAGAAAGLVAAAFVILDFVNGNWVGGAFGAAVCFSESLCRL